MDDVREVFTFDVNNVSSYELGKARHGRIPSEAPLTSSDKENKNDVIVMETCLALQDTLSNMQTEIQKVLIGTC